MARAASLIGRKLTKLGVRRARHQLAWASRGLLTMAVADRTWALPRSRALWIPVGVPHSVLATDETRFVSLYFDGRTGPIDLDAPTVIDSSGLLGHLMNHLTASMPAPARERAESILFDLIRPLPVTSLALPPPNEERIGEIAAALTRDPADARTLAEWGRSVGASGRTLARAVRRDTGMTFATWRTQTRVAAVLQSLGQVVPVARVAEQVGYATPSAFVAAFKRTVGATPGQYFASSDAIGR